MLPRLLALVAGGKDTSLLSSVPSATRVRWAAAPWSLRLGVHIPLQQFMPDRPSLNYSLRARHHNKTLIARTTQLNNQDFILRSI